MKKFITVLMLAMLSFSIFADTYTLSAKQNEDGEIVVSNAKGRVQDRVRIINNTDMHLDVVVMGEHKKRGTVKVAAGHVKPNDGEFFASKYEDKLAHFRSFTIKLGEGKILSCNAESTRDDLYFEINKTDLKKPGTGITVKDVEEILKWKELLDSGVITEDDFNTKKKEILGL